MKFTSLAEVGAWHRLLCQVDENGTFVGEGNQPLTLQQLADLWHVSRALAAAYMDRWIAHGYVIKSNEGYALEPESACLFGYQLLI